MEENIKGIKILQFGVGGTGSYLVPPLYKYLMSLKKTNNYNKIEYFLYDDDIIEEKNIIRQNFSSYDIGKKKIYGFKDFNDALLIMRDKKITDSNYSIMHSDILKDNNNNSIVLVVGCVDNIDARINIAKMIEEYINTYIPSMQQFIYYIDSGNLTDTGQILVFDYSRNRIRASSNTSKILEIFDNEETRKLDKIQPSCDDNGDQTIMANFQAASILYNVITELLIKKDTTIKKIAFMRYERDIDCDTVAQLKNLML